MPILIGLLAACVGLQTAQGIHWARQNEAYYDVIERATQIQARLVRAGEDVLTPRQAARHSAALSSVLADAREGYRPHLFPIWLQSCAIVGAPLAVVGLVAVWAGKRAMREPTDEQAARSGPRRSAIARVPSATIAGPPLVHEPRFPVSP